MELLILKDDLDWLDTRIKELSQAIQELGPDFRDVFNQSSETWHDNAPFDALRDKQSVLFAEYSHLRAIRQQVQPASASKNSSKVGIGSYVSVAKKKYYIAGDWTPRAGEKQGDYIIISRQSPLAQAILGKKVGHTTKYGIIEWIGTTQ